ncbi:exodeoxyribonuclease VII large subunit [Pseudobacter ginsenosidimutans]|uniref:Exodeoxyribonuclease 7 large subunit n=1 Tax=Pseudobacter ginsenosidimutans TaxID=661488 RepID=A0A4Q7MUS9_9BACT|nr:exodeoxyribonuclease VII large subunit [Pseudobacter ginsenosidimutans]QEC41489.1 exodeoxyribonuclease VII large subunit [Pseudobacter ginsenosidimutans]RZS71729.1 exodeoxyribonuclease VII large subunit [Pseudobacter ginsenosidimutans]
MPENITDRTVFSLLEVQRSIQKTLTDRYGSSFWVKAEMNKLNYYKQSGHCYPELVEKQQGKVIAQLKSVLWREDFVLINKHFLSFLNEPLKDGIKILFQAKLIYDPVHGLSLRILDIDPSYTLGDLEKEKMESISRLVNEGIFDQNKLLPIPLLPQRIAVISVESSKGYVDFIEVLEGNPWRYKFFHYLFPSLLQGEKAIDTIRLQLARIRKVIHHFDVVAIVRGGGGDVGLSVYNNYELAKAIALFPIPVITGIGHATNDTVVEMVAHANAITPTKIAEYLIQRFHNFSVPVMQATEKITDRARRLILEERNKLRSEVKLFRSVTATVTLEHRSQLMSSVALLKQQAKYLLREHQDELTKVQLTEKTAIFLKEQNSGLAQLERNINNMSPEKVLQRGFSITLKDGKLIRDAAEVKEGDTLETVLANGTISSTALSIKKQ